MIKESTEDKVERTLEQVTAEWMAAWGAVELAQSATERAEAVAKFNALDVEHDVMTGFAWVHMQGVKDLIPA